MLREALTLDRLRAMEPDEAAAWFVACGVDGLTASDEALLADWLAESDAHPAAFERATRAWDSFSDFDDDEILAAMREHALAPPVRRWWVSRSAIAAAAAIVLIVAASVLLLPRFWRADPAPEITEYASSRTGIREVVLPDGSHMSLDANSVVKAQFAANARTLYLVRGRAFFDVQHDAQRPFSVTANGRRIVDLGTRFDVSVIGGSLRVVLERGRVSIQSLKPGVPAITLESGQEFVEGQGASKAGAPGTVDVNVRTNWRRGLIDLADVPLANAVAEINRYSTAQIVIRDPAVGRMRISGEFRAGDGERFARTIAELHPVRVERRGNTIEMLPSK